MYNDIHGFYGSRGLNTVLFTAIEDGKRGAKDRNNQRKRENGIPVVKDVRVIKAISTLPLTSGLGSYASETTARVSM